MPKSYIRFSILYSYLLLITVALLFLALSLLSDFTYDIFYKARYGEVFFDMWNRLINGDVTIDHGVIPGEAFLVNGKVIAYFLPFPSIIRGAFEQFALGRYPVPSMLMAVFVYCISIHCLIREVSVSVFNKVENYFISALYPFCLLPIISLFTEASMYWEAIIWAYALFVTQAFLFLQVLRNHKISTKYILMIISGLILFTRPTFGVASGFLIVIFIFHEIKNGRCSIKENFPYLLFLSFVVLLGLLNYQKWGSPFEFAPLAFHEQLIGTDRGYQASNSSSFSMMRIPETLTYYFSVSKTNLDWTSPFIHIGGSDLYFDWAYFDYREPRYSIGLILPLHILVGAFGVFSLVRQSELTYGNQQSLYLYGVVSIIPGLLTLMLISMALRYRTEFYVLLVFGSVIGGSIASRALSKASFVMLAIPVTVVSLFLVLNGLFAERIMWFGCDGRNPKLVCDWFKVKYTSGDFSYDDDFFLTDENWIRGISRSRAGFFVPNIKQYSKSYKTGKYVFFPDGTARKIKDIQANGKYLNIFLEGEVLSSERIGLPTKFEISDLMFLPKKLTNE